MEIEGIGYRKNFQNLIRTQSGHTWGHVVKRLSRLLFCVCYFPFMDSSVDCALRHVCRTNEAELVLAPLIVLR
jgi:hypothetical protein